MSNSVIETPYTQANKKTLIEKKPGFREMLLCNLNLAMRL